MGIDLSSQVVIGRFCRYLLGFVSPLVGSVVHRRISVRDVLRDESRCFSPLKLLFSSGPRSLPRSTWFAEREGGKQGEKADNGHRGHRRYPIRTVDVRLVSSQQYR